MEAIDCRPTRAGSGWLLDFLSKAQFAAVAVDGASGQQLLADAMKAAHLKAPVLPTVKQIITANGGFGYRSLTEGGHIELLDSIILACWQCSEGKEKRRQRTSY